MCHSPVVDDETGIDCTDRPELESLLPENPSIVLTAGASAPEGLAVVEEIMDVVGGTLTDGDPSNEVDISMAGFVLTRTQFPARSLFPRMHKGSF